MNSIEICDRRRWALVTIDTAAGRLIMIRQNAGETPSVEGDAVTLCWRPEDMRTRA
jgi:hypothetical protein